MRFTALTIGLLFTNGIIAIPANCAEQSVALVISDRDCAAFRPYVQDPSVEYKVGVDSHGNAVAPADLGGGLQVSPDISFPVTVDIRPWTELNGRLAQRHRQNQPAYELGTGTEATVGTVTVRDGQVLFNGQPLSSPYENAIAQACTDYLKHSRDGGREHDGRE